MAELEVRPTKLKHNASVKDKKAIARTRASQGSSSNAAREELVQFTPQKLKKANKLQTTPKPNCDGVSKQEREAMARPRTTNELQLSSLSGSTMGNQRGSDGYGVSGGSDSCNPCKTDLGEGLVQREALKAWRDILSLIETCVREGRQALIVLAWKKAMIPWWQVLTDRP